MIQALFDAGPTKQGGMGETPLEWQDVLAFSQATNDISEPWERKALFKMSEAYFEGRQMGKNPFAKSPLEKDSSDPGKASN